MNRTHYSLSSTPALSVRRILFWTFWFLGIIAGVFLAAENCEDLSSLMCQVLMTPVSIVGLAATLFLPLLFLVLSILFHSPLPAYFCVLGKGIGFGYLLLLLSSCFNETFWFVSVLYLFSDACLLFVFFPVALKIVADSKASRKQLFGMYLIWTLTVGFMDIFFISPVLYGFIRLF